MCKGRASIEVMAVFRAAKQQKRFCSGFIGCAEPGLGSLHRSGEGPRLPKGGSPRPPSTLRGSPRPARRDTAGGAPPPPPRPPPPPPRGGGRGRRGPPPRRGEARRRR